MRLTNFEISQSIELTGLGQRWDLHNCADFAGIELLPETGAVRLRWTVLEEPALRRMGFGQDNLAQWCAIRCDGVKSIRLVRVEEGTGPSDSRTLHEVRLAERPPAGSAEPQALPLSPVGRRSLLLEFMDGFDVEIVADAATLEAGPELG